MCFIAEYVYGYFDELTADEVVDFPEFPILHREVDVWGCCTSVTIERLSEGNCTSLTSPPNGFAVPCHLLLHTTQTQDIHVLEHDLFSKHFLLRLACLHINVVVI